MVVKVTNVALLTLFQQVVVAIAIAAIASVKPADLPPVMLVLLMMATVGKSQAQTCSG